MVRPKLNEQEIERRLRATRAPHPPPDLLDRLKADIPEGLTYAALDRARPPVRIWRNSLAAAASVLALVGMSYVMLRTLESGKRENAAPVAEMVPAAPSAATEAPPSRTQPVGMAAPQASAAPTSGDAAGVAKSDGWGAKREARERPAEEDASREVQVQVAAPAIVEQQTVAYDRTDEAKVAIAAATPAPEGVEVEGVVGGVIGGVASGVVAPQMPAPPAPAARTERTADAARKARSATLRLAFRSAAGGEVVDAEADPVSTFGLNVGDESFAAARDALLAGRMPAPASIREEEIINHFDYGDRAGRGPVSLAAEGAPAPFGPPRTQVLRIGVVTAPSAGSRPVAGDAKVQVEFDPDLVASYRLIGYRTGPPAAAGGVTLASGTAVSALYEVRLERLPSRRDRIAHVRLQYIDPARRSRSEITHDVTGADFSTSWEAAPPSLRLASLAAAWAEILQRGLRPASIPVPPRELFERAQRLSGELAGDERVAEFVALAARTAKLLE